MSKVIRTWRTTEEAYLRQHYATKTAQELATYLNRPLQSVSAKLMRLELYSGPRGTFQKGHQTNVGRPRPDASERLRQHNPVKPCPALVGATRPIRVGKIPKYLEQKVVDAQGKARWVRQHRLRWEQLHGPIPVGHVLACRTANTLDTDPANWECISPAERARRNHDADKAAATMRELMTVVRQCAADGKVHNSPAGRRHARTVAHPSAVPTGGREEAPGNPAGVATAA